MEPCSDEAAKRVADSLGKGDLHGGREALMECLRDHNYGWSENMLTRNTQFVNKVADQVPANGKIDLIPVYDEYSYLKEYQLKPKENRQALMLLRPTIYRKPQYFEKG